jgi:hypothetical protein
MKIAVIILALFACSSNAAIFLNNAGSRVFAPDSASLDITTAITITAWINQFNTNSPFGTSGIVAKGREVSGTAANYQFRIARGLTNSPEFYIHSGGFQQAKARNFGSGHPTQLGTSNKWFFVAVAHTYGTPASTRFYIGDADGVTEYTNHWYSGAGTGVPSANTERLVIGQDENGGGYFSGQIEEVAIYAAQLTYDEIKRLGVRIKYQPLLVRRAEQRAYWPMTEGVPGQTFGASDRFYDLSGNRNHLIPSNSPVVRAIGLSIP